MTKLSATTVIKTVGMLPKTLSEIYHQMSVLKALIILDQYENVKDMQG